MKPVTPLLLALASVSSAMGGDRYINLVRQSLHKTSVIWDMPVAPEGVTPSVPALEAGGAQYQLWTINQVLGQDYLLNQKLVGTFLPKADLKVVTLDSGGRVPRTRVDQPFTVEIELKDLLTGVGMPRSASSVLLERTLGPHRAGVTSLDSAGVLSNPPFSRVYLSSNGTTKLQFSASALTSPDPTKASGEEHFVIHELSESDSTQTQIASAMIQVWPVASGVIKGITQGQQLRFKAPPIELLLDDLYPRSDTYLLLFEGTQINGNEGAIVKSFPMDRDTVESHVISLPDELDSKLGKDGTYTLALVSDTVYGRELLCDPVTFQVKRTMEVNAMQVNFSDGREP